MCLIVQPGVWGSKVDLSKTLHVVDLISYGDQQHVTTSM